MVLTAAFAHNLAYSWLAWGDPVVDCGRELEVARQVAQGRLLYGEVRWFYPPLAPHVNAGMFALFGVHTGVLMVAGALSAAAMALLVFALARRLAGPLAATVVATAFLYLCAFGHLYYNGIFNWILPYTYGATYGMLAATASLFLLVRHVQDGRGRDLSWSVVCLAVAGLAKVEAFVPAAAAHAVFVVTARPRLLPYAAAGAGTVGVFAFFWLHVGSRLIDDYRLIVQAASDNPIVPFHMGFGDWGKAMAALDASAAALAAVMVLAAGGALLARRPGMPAAGRRIVEIAGAVLAGLVYWWIPVFDQLRILPVLLGVLLVGRAVEWWRAGAGRPAVLAHLLVLVFALACLMRTPLATGAFHYGFYLLPVPLLVFGVTWFATLPAWLPGRPTGLVAWLGLGLFGAIVATHYDASRDMYARHTALVATARGRMYMLDDLHGAPTGSAHAETVRFLAQYPPETRVLVIPIGIGLTFLSGLTPVCGMDSFTPAELTGPFEDRLLRCLQAAPPDLVVGVSVNLAEYGVQAFGQGYAERTAAWIAANYDMLARFGPNGYVFVMRRHAA